MPANSYGRQVTVSAANKSGGALIAGDVCVVDTTNNLAFTTSTAGAVTNLIIAVCQESIANNATGRFLTSGYAALINTSASVTRGNFGKTHTVAKQAVDAGSVRVTGTFCQFLTGGTTPDAIVYPSDLGGASLTNPMDGTGQLIYGGASGTPTKLAAGTTAQVLIGSATAPTWGYAPHTGSEVFLTSITTMVNANTYYDGPSAGALAAGTYFIWGECNVKNITDASAFITLRLWDGTNVFSEGNAYIPAAGAHATVSVGTYVVLGSPTTVKISGASNQGTSHSTIEVTVALNGTANKASKIVAIRIA